MLQLVRPDGGPNVNDLWRMAKDIEALKADVKSIVYDLASSLERNLSERTVQTAVVADLTSKPCTQADVESSWAAFWSGQLGQVSRYHRAAWEVRYVLQALHDAGVEAGAKVLNLGPASAVDEALTEMGVEVSSNPAAASGTFDACWSLAVAGHQGSIAAGSAFVTGSLKPLRVGGVAVHTFDFNFGSDEATLDNWPSVLFRRSDIAALAAALEKRGHDVAPLDFDVGRQALDRFIDLPPFEPAGSETLRAQWVGLTQGVHLKASIDGFATTSYGLIVRRRL
jgi:hypothetical protein